MLGCPESSFLEKGEDRSEETDFQSTVKTIKEKYIIDLTRAGCPSVLSPGFSYFVSLRGYSVLYRAWTTQCLRSLLVFC